MITIDEKIDFFKRIVLDKVNQEQEELKKSLDKELSQRVIAFEKQAAKKAESYIKQFVDKAKEEKKAMILNSKKKNKNKILEIENLLNQRVYESVLEKCDDFTQTPAYLEIFKKLFKQVKKDLEKFDRLDVYIMSRDYLNNIDYIQELFRNNLPNKKLSFNKATQNIRGGFVVYNSNETMKLDVTLESIIRQNSNFIGNQVKNLLHLEGDQHG